MKTNLENIKQALIELMADYLDSEGHIREEAMAKVKDPVSREESELHIRMANAAFREYEKTIADANELRDNCHNTNLYSTLLLQSLHKDLKEFKDLGFTDARIGLSIAIEQVERYMRGELEVRQQ